MTTWGPEGPPRLSPSTAKVLLSRSPLHAFTQHRLGGGEESEDSDEKEQGRVLDRLLFGVGPEIVVVSVKKEDGTIATDWKTKAAQTARLEASKAGKIAIMAGKLKVQQDIVDAWKAQLVAHDIAFTGQSQVKLDWESMGVPCRGKLDHLILDVSAGHADIIDLKALEDASQQAITRAVVNYGWDTQGAAYVEGVEANYPALAGRVRYRLVCGEKKKSDAYAINVVTFGGTMRELGERKWRRAKRIWGECLRTGEFPGYPGLPIEANAYQLAAEEEAQMPGSDNGTEPF